MSYPVMPLGFLGSQGDNDTYRIERSLRFNSADSAYLNRTPASAGNLTTWTWSGWVKRGSLGSQQFLFSADRAASSEGFGIQFVSSDTLQIYAYNGSAFVYNYITTQVFRDVSSWYHIVVTLDTTNATSTDRVRIYVNGSRITEFGTSTAPSQNATGYVNATQSHALGRSNYSTSLYLNGYLTEINFIDGQALTPSSFGETDAITGRWKAKAYSGTYGTNGFYLSFKNNGNVSALGTDQAFADGKKAENNFWTVNNFSVTAGAGNDSLVDSPTNYGTDTGVGGEVRGNYCTLNPLSTTTATLSNGNLSVVTFVANPTTALGTFEIPKTGKWYWEYVATSNGTISFSGISTHHGSGVYVVYYADGQKYVDGVNSNYGASYGNNDVIGVAVDSDSGQITFYKNGSSQGAISYTISNKSLFPYLSDGSGNAGASVSYDINFGQRPFAYTAPSGFKALCTTNLPTPTIRKPSSYMDVVTYTGNSSTQTISSLGFMPDLIWCKSRSTARNHSLTDSVRGLDKQLYTNLTNSEGSQSNQITAFNSNGFSLGDNIGGVGSVNENTLTYVAWAWDEAPIAGMDIVGYTGNGTGQDINHSLGVEPKLMIVKRRDATANWPVYHSSYWNITNGLLFLNSTSVGNSNFGVFGSAPSSTTFRVNTDASVNANTGTYIAYLFAEVEGFSRFGSYTGNGSADGPFVWCGFRPRWILIKDTAGAINWRLLDTSRDTFNLSQNGLFPNTGGAESTTNMQMDILSNGFKIRATADINANGNNHIFAAFAESPFKYARAR